MDLKNNTSTIKTSFAEISYIHVKNSGHTVVFIHGNSACKEVFQRQFNTFKNKYNMFAIDLPGHGKSSKNFWIKFTTKKFSWLVGP